MECRITPKVGVVIVAGGKGVRMGGQIPKQFVILGQAPLLVHTINNFAKAFKSSEIVVVLPRESREYWLNLSSRFEVAAHQTVDGGDERYHSVKAGVEALSEDVEIIAVQDGVRPLSSQELLSRLYQDAIDYGSAIPVVEVNDSFREVDGGDSKIVDRSKLRAVQTPQLFDSRDLRRAYRSGYQRSFTDDASVVESMGIKVHLTEGERSNIKITTREDLIYAEMILEERNGGESI